MTARRKRIVDIMHSLLKRRTVGWGSVAGYTRTKGSDVGKIRVEFLTIASSGEESFRTREKSSYCERVKEKCQERS